MENQRKSFSIIAASCAAVLALMAGSAQANSAGTILVEGQVIAGTCSPPAAITRVHLPPVAAQALRQAGDSAGATNFDITLTGCPPGVPVRARFDTSSYVDPATGMLTNTTGDNPAQNVQIAVLDRDGNVISLGAPQTDAPVTADSSGNVTLTYGFMYRAVGAVTAGQIKTYAYYTAEYP